MSRSKPKAAKSYKLPFASGTAGTIAIGSLMVGILIQYGIALFISYIFANIWANEYTKDDPKLRKLWKISNLVLIASITIIILVIAFNDVKSGLST